MSFYNNFTRVYMQKVKWGKKLLYLCYCIHVYHGYVCLPAFYRCSSHHCNRLMVLRESMRLVYCQTGLLLDPHTEQTDLLLVGPVWQYNLTGYAEITKEWTWVETNHTNTETEHPTMYSCDSETFGQYGRKFWKLA